MLWIIRTSPGRLGLCRTPTAAQSAADPDHPGTPVMLAGPNWAMPDAAFIPLLNAKGFVVEMMTESPESAARWERVLTAGVFVLPQDPQRSEKAILARSGLTRANAHSRAPDPGTFIED